MAFCTKCESNMSTMAVRCEHCQYGFTDSCLNSKKTDSSDQVAGDAVLMAGAVGCGAANLYVGIQSIGAVVNGEWLQGLLIGPAAIAVLSAMMVSFWRVAR